MAEKYFIGIDIGGTKSAVILLSDKGEAIAKEQFPTDTGTGAWRDTLDRMTDLIDRFLDIEPAAAIGVSCGGPLNSQKGVILSPPNLPGWDDVPVVDIFREKFRLPVALENDANAGALAEWQFGAGRGTKNMIFLTFGTGLGAGLILDGRLYKGTNDYGGETGHIRLEDDGPIGYHKRGSFEGFCSGTGLAQLMAVELLCQIEEKGKDFVLQNYRSPGDVTGRDVVEWAKEGDALALSVVHKCGQYFGKGLSVLIDLLNPEKIVVGSMGVRLGDLLFKPARMVIEREAIPEAAEVCDIVPAELGECIGEYAALCVAKQAGE
jgi:glucokinase